MPSGWLVRLMTASRQEANDHGNVSMPRPRIYHSLVQTPWHGSDFGALPERRHLVRTVPRYIWVDRELYS